MASKRKKTSASRLKSIPVPEAPTHTETLAMCDRLLAYMETRSHLTTTSRMLIPFTSSPIMNNIMLNNKLRSLIFFHVIYLCMYQIVCCVKQIIRKYNESHKLCSYKLTLLSLICDTHEMNIQRQTSVISNFLYIEVFTQVPWTSIYPSFTVYIYPAPIGLISDQLTNNIKICQGHETNIQRYVIITTLYSMCFLQYSSLN